MNPAANSTSGSAGTRPPGARDEKEAAARIRAMFSSIAPRYDLLNHLLSFSFDRVWRRRTARRFRHLLKRPEARVLDLCCGTGDLTQALERAARPDSAETRGAAVWGSDFAHPMLVRAVQKAEAHRHCIAYFEADATRLPVPDGSFDLLTVAFGFRNLANYGQGLREMYRVLRPGGEVGLLEFTEPRSSLFAPLYHFYFRRVVPRLGRAISGSPDAYAYLPSSVAQFPDAESLRAMMAATGFVETRFELWMMGTVALHSGRKP